MWTYTRETKKTAVKPKVGYDCPRDRPMTEEGLKEDNIPNRASWRKKINSRTGDSIGQDKLNGQRRKKKNFVAVFVVVDVVIAAVVAVGLMVTSMRPFRNVRRSFHQIDRLGRSYRFSEYSPHSRVFHRNTLKNRFCIGCEWRLSVTAEVRVMHELPLMFIKILLGLCSFEAHKLATESMVAHLSS